MDNRYVKYSISGVFLIIVIFGLWLYIRPSELDEFEDINNQIDSTNQGL